MGIKCLTEITKELYPRLRRPYAEVRDTCTTLVVDAMTGWHKLSGYNKSNGHISGNFL